MKTWNGDRSFLFSLFFFSAIHVSPSIILPSATWWASDVIRPFLIALTDCHSLVVLGTRI